MATSATCWPARGRVRTAGGVAGLGQLRAAGLSIGQINARVRAGRLHRGVFAVGHRRLTRPRLTARGYRVVRFTYRQVVHAPAAVGATLRALLEPAA